MSLPDTNSLNTNSFGTDSFLTVAGPAEATIIEKKSRFIGYVSTASNETEAQEFLNSIRAMHRSATHNCYAWQIGSQDQWQRSGDDGEPAGTAGRPILETIKTSDLKNTVVVVTRYFGGILLGTGGLVRAYSASARAAIAAAGIVRCQPASLFALTVEYSDWQKLTNFLRNTECQQLEPSFRDKVDVQVLIPNTASDSFAARITDLFGYDISPLILDNNALMQTPV